MSTREAGVIEAVRYDKEHHGVLTLWLTIKFGSSVQGFGGLALGRTKNDPLSKRYHDDLCRCLGVWKIEDAVGIQVNALRCWGFYNDNIEGIENAKTGAQFIHWRWRRQVLKEGNTPLQDRKASLESTISWAKRRLKEAENELHNASVGYVEW